MSDDRAHALAGWFILQAADADPSRLPHHCKLDTLRGLRMASEALLKASERFPDRAQLCLWSTSVPSLEPLAWRRVFLAAGARYFSAALRRRIGDALACRLVSEIGPEQWRVCLRWNDPSLAQITAAEALMELELVERVGAGLIMAYLQGISEALSARVLLCFPETDVHSWMSLSPTLGNMACEKIARHVLEQELR